MAEGLASMGAPSTRRGAALPAPCKRHRGVTAAMPGPHVEPTASGTEVANSTPANADIPPGCLGPQGEEPTPTLWKAYAPAVNRADVEPPESQFAVHGLAGCIGARSTGRERPGGPHPGRSGPRGRALSRGPGGSGPPERGAGRLRPFEGLAPRAV